MAASKRPIPPLTREQCRAVDRYAIEQLGIPGVVLMENAGRNAADLIQAWVREYALRISGKRQPGMPDVSIVCGKGNNGGDGFVIARHLVNRGYDVCVDLAAQADTLTGDAAINYRIALAMGITIREMPDDGATQAAAARWHGSIAVIDALLGTGFAGEVRDPLARIINQINAIRSADPRPLVIAVDVPSGLDADTGRVPGPVVRADRTITFLASKTGYTNQAARDYLGDISVADIGAPTDFILDRLSIPRAVQ